MKELQRLFPTELGDFEGAAQLRKSVVVKVGAGATVFDSLGGQMSSGVSKGGEVQGG